MPSSGWLTALTRHFARAPELSPAHATHCGPAGGNGVSTVSTHLPAEDGTPVARSTLTRPTTPWSLDTLDEEIQRTEQEQEGSGAAGRRSSPTSPPKDATQSTPITHYHYHAHPGESDVRDLSLMEEAAPHLPRPASAPRACRPPSATSRPPSVASRHSTPVHPTQQGHASPPSDPSAVQLPAQVEDPQEWAGEDGTEGRGHYYIPPVIPPLFDRPLVAPTPASTRCNTPVWDLDGEKRVRFLEPEVVAQEAPSRPDSVSSQYSHIVKNSTRYAFQPSQPLTAEQGPHNPRFCNCPCHFLPIGRRSVGVQVKRTDPEPPRPRHYRLYFTPTTRGLQQGNIGTRSLALASRALFSQVGLVVVVVAWWVAGAVVFSRVEGAAEHETVSKMAELRTDLVLGLATELRQVLPYDVVWRTKIETYMGKMEAAVLDAARAGYASRAPTWTMAGALLYSASLTTLVGPGGMTLRTGFSRVFAVLFSLVGAPLVLLLAISGAFTVREGVGKAWAWRCGRGRQGKVGESAVVEGRTGQYGGGAAPEGEAAIRPASSSSSARSTPNGPGELASRVSDKHKSEMHQASRVPALDSTLRSSSLSTPRDSDQSSSGSPPAQDTPQYASAGGEQSFVGVNPALQRRIAMGPRRQIPPRRGQSPVPWAVYLGLVVAYIVLGLVVFAPIQRWSLPSSVYIVVSTLLTLDHDGLGERHLVGSSKVVVPYVLYMLVGLVLVAALVISVWSSLCASLVTTGKYLAVVRPTPR
ncbi:uncharacterized protein LOC135090465 [Scylla paramamosain]|uniref:uncharacterized protein LOC135090465 n=1 Tax=Scylla paramamosain TaxID=85552 RepID=UPI0030834B43